MKLTFKTIFLTALIGVALLSALTLPASAEKKNVVYRLADGSIQTMVLDVDPTATLEDISDLVPAGSQPIFMEPLRDKDSVELGDADQPQPGAELQSLEDALSEDGSGNGDPAQDGSIGQDETQAREQAQRRAKPKKLNFDKGGPKVRLEAETKAKPRPEPKPPSTELRNSDGSPTEANPGFFEALPGPSSTTGVPNFVIRKFRVPPFLLPIYQAAGIQYGVRWEVLAAINEIETDYGRNLNVSSAGALGWMQFMPATWEAYGTDANKDGKKDPYNPVDAIFAAARYLKAAGYEQDPRTAVFAYNHANWYVDSVMLRARLISGVPADLIGSLTGLTEGRFPIAARARYADDVGEKSALKRVKAGEDATNLVEGDDDRRSIEIFSKQDAPVVATNDGVIKKVGESKRLGRYVVLQDVYGNRYTYSGLGSVSKLVAVAREEGEDERGSARALAANAPRDKRPTTAASKGSQPERDEMEDPPGKAATDDAPAQAKQRIAASDDSEPQDAAPVKRRLFAHPDVPGARQSGGLEQLLDSRARREGGFSRYAGSYARPIDLDPKRFKLTRLEAGSRVIAGTVLGKVGRPDEDKAAHLDFAIRPAGAGAPEIDPKPILDGWKLLEATSIYRASGRNALRAGGTSIGQILLMPKPMIERRVLGDERIDVYADGRKDIAAGQVDRRVLASLAYLAESGLRPTVTSLRSGHGYFTASGNVSAHSSGNAVDISAINGISILGHQEPGGITEQTVRSLMRLQGTMAPNQIISLLDLGANTMPLSDHGDHIHVGFQPRFGANERLGRQAQAVLKPGQWPQLLQRLEEIENPVVPTKASPYALPAKK